jgi:hypothetical protein
VDKVTADRDVGAGKANHVSPLHSFLKGELLRTNFDPQTGRMDSFPCERKIVNETGKRICRCISLMNFAFANGIAILKNPLCDGAVNLFPVLFSKLNHRLFPVLVSQA